MKRTDWDIGGSIITDKPLTKEEVQKVKKEWYDKHYANTGFGKIITFDSWWIRFKKWGKFFLKCLLIISLITSCEYCRREFNKNFKEEMVILQKLWEHRLKNLKEWDGKN